MLLTGAYNLSPGARHFTLVKKKTIRYHVFFNSYEGYIKKILPLNTEIIISGKINFFRNKYQITNPTQVKESNENILETQNKYSLTDGLTINKYNNIINEVLKKLPDLDEWLNDDIKKKFNKRGWVN